MKKCTNCNNWSEEHQVFQTCDSDSLCERCYELKIQDPCLSCYALVGKPCNTNDLQRA